MALSSSPNMRVKTVDVRPGLAVLRYTSADASGSPPLLRLVIPEESGELRVIMRAGKSGAGAHAGSDNALFCKCRVAPHLVLHVIPRHGTSGNVSLALEYLTDERALGQSRNTNHSASSGHALQDVRWRDEDMPSLSMLAHVSRLGDRRVRDGRVGRGARLSASDRRASRYISPRRVEGLELLYRGCRGRKGSPRKYGRRRNFRGHTRPGAAIALRGVSARRAALERLHIAGSRRRFLQHPCALRREDR